MADKSLQNEMPKARTKIKRRPSSLLLEAQYLPLETQYLSLENQYLPVETWYLPVETWYLPVETHYLPLPWPFACADLVHFFTPMAFGSQLILKHYNFFT